MSGDDDPSSEAHLRYSIGLMTKHPSLDPPQITKALGIAPKHAWLAGAPRMTPAGTSLPGSYPNSCWVASKVVCGQRPSSRGAVAMLERLEAPALMRRAALKVELSVGVLPTMQ